MKFTFIINDLELRSCGEHLSLDCEHNTSEIVMFGKINELEDYCFTIAYWLKDSEGYYLKFVGDRTFNTNKEVFMQLAEQGQRILDNIFKNNQNGN